MSWSELFDAYLVANKISGLKAALDLKVSPSFVHYWRKGTTPRNEKKLARIERWSKGNVPASAARPRKAA
jgi:hypothetical protein